MSATAEGWRAGRNAAAFVVRTLEGEATQPASRRALAVAGERIAAIPPPSSNVVSARDERLTAAIRAALPLLRAGLAEQAQAVLEDALA